MAVSFGGLETDTSQRTILGCFQLRLE